ncbi:MAG: hypothetical protein AAGF12_02460 [Myxococcota bacterium]
MNARWTIPVLFLVACQGSVGDPSLGPAPFDPNDPRDPSNPLVPPSVPDDPNRPPVPPPDVEPPVPFEALPPGAALSKVKFLLTGLPPTQAELEPYLADPAVLPGLIDTWMEHPAFEARLKEMAELLFQMGSRTDDLRDHLGLGIGNRLSSFESQGAQIQASVNRTWTETVWRIVSERRDFRETMNTNTYMMNVPLMSVLAFADANPRDDFGEDDPSYLFDRFPGAQLRMVVNGNIPLRESVDPSSPNFLRFSIVPDWRASREQFCRGRAQEVHTRQADVLTVLSGLLYGRIAPNCQVRLDHFRPEDFEYRPVTIVHTSDPNQRSLFFDIEDLRSTDTLRLGTPRYGFMGDIGFLSRWVTNDSNQHRVTANQALIVALGQHFAPDAVSTLSDAAEPDGMHADPSTECWACHRALDPMRDFFRQSYTALGSERVAGSNNEPVPAVAAFGVGLGQPVEGNGVKVLADALFSHPDLAKAWADKLCHFANGAACAPRDPALQPAVEAFIASGHDFKVLLRGVLSSDAVTFQARTWTWDFASSAGVGLASRADTCLRLGQLTGTAICDDRGVRDRIGGRPDWIFQRGAPQPSLPAQANVFATLSTRRACEYIARRRLDAGDLPSDVDELVLFLSSEVMGIVTGDPRAAPIQEILRDHHQEALSSTNPTNAARETFVLACESPVANARAL